MHWKVLVFMSALSGFAIAQVQLENVVFQGSTVAITHAGDNRLFITLQSGQIVILENDSVLPTPFLNIDPLVDSGGERGLLSTAFHPDYENNGFFFVNYTNNDGDTVIARYQVSANPNQASPTSAAILMTIDQPFPNHNGGQLQFGPDGYLYIGMGDGGAGGDPSCLAQNPSSLQGKMLRLDIDQNVDTAPFHGIPADNPFLSDPDTLDEIWATGLRNPWRFSFDRKTGDLYIADVGQGQLEEVDFQPAESSGGENYGWDVMEGTNCFENDPDCPPDTPPCNDPALTDPVVEYTRTDGRCSIIGGYLYRGCLVPELWGKYLYSDFCSGDIWASWESAPGIWTTQLLPVSASGPRTFGEDIDAEVYIQSGSAIQRFFSTDPEILIPFWNSIPEQSVCFTEPINLLDLLNRLD